MKALIKNIPTYWLSSVKDEIRKNPIREVMIAEHDEDGEENGWYLIHTGVEQRAIFDSSNDIAAGRITRTYQHPDLPENYAEKGPYMWIGKKEAEPVAGNNREAKVLLKSHEWFV